MIDKLFKLHHVKSLNLAITTVLFVLIFIFVKYIFHQFSLEFLQINTLTGSAIAGATFICSFLLSGLITDYKEAERIPAEFRSSLENILEEGMILERRDKRYNVASLKNDIKSIILNFFIGLSHERGHADLSRCLDAVDKLSYRFMEMETAGMAPNYIVRLKSEQGNVRKCILRVLHIQKTQFLPSAYILTETIVALIIILLLFIKTEGSPESMILFGFISYMFLYIVRLIRKIEQPFREGDSSLDDVSLFLLHDFECKIK